MNLEFFKFGFLKTIKSPEQRKAWFVAILADAIQIVGMPLFAEGGLSPLDTALASGPPSPTLAGQEGRLSMLVLKPFLHNIEHLWIRPYDQNTNAPASAVRKFLVGCVRIR
jgi:hypothetical protein